MSSLICSGNPKLQFPQVHMLQPGVRICKDILCRLQFLGSSVKQLHQPQYAILFGLREESIGRGLIIHVKVSSLPSSYAKDWLTKPVTIKGVRAFWWLQSWTCIPPITIAKLPRTHDPRVLCRKLLQLIKTRVGNWCLLFFSKALPPNGDHHTDVIASNHFDLFQSAMLKVFTASFLGRNPGKRCAIYC
jgi:hypothetical protein